jgi:hypothetical protein
MRKILHYRLPLLLAALVLMAGCGSVSGLSRETADAPMRIADFNRVEVIDFSASDRLHYDDAKRQADYDASLATAQHVFADKIAEAIKASGAFAEVSRQTSDSGAVLRVTGNISRYDEGNIVARGLTGFAGQTHFDSVVSVSDARSGHALATLTIDRNSWPLPVGASVSTIQTTGFFMNEAAQKIANELAAKKKGASGK